MSSQNVKSKKAQNNTGQSTKTTPQGKNQVASSSSPSRALLEKVHWPLYQYILGVVLCGAVIQLLSFAGGFWHPELVSTCNLSPYLRASNPDALRNAHVPAHIRVALFFVAPRLALVIYLAMLWRVAYSKRALIASFLWLVGAYFPGLFLLEFLKHHSDDWACHTSKPNGISGHFYYISYHLAVVFYASALVRDKVLRLRRNPWARSLSWLRAGASLLALAALALEGFVCYWYGYHSLRQIAYGSVYGLFFSAGILFASEYMWRVYSPQKVKQQ